MLYCVDNNDTILSLHLYDMQRMLNREEKLNTIDQVSEGKLFDASMPFFLTKKIKHVLFCFKASRLLLVRSGNNHGHISLPPVLGM